VDKESKTIEAVRNDKIISPKLYNPGIPEALEQVVMRALDRNIKRRYQSAREFGDALERVLTEHYPEITGDNLSSFTQFLYPNVDILRDAARKDESISFWARKASDDSEIMRDIESRIAWSRRNFFYRFFVSRWPLVLTFLILAGGIGLLFLISGEEKIMDTLRRIFTKVLKFIKS
jgi:hypothetical protein